MTAATAETAVTQRVFRIEVRGKVGEPDPVAQSVLAQGRLELVGLSAVSTAKVYLIESPLDAVAVQRISDELVADPVDQVGFQGAHIPAADTRIIEVHYQPGVMDPVAQSTREAICGMFSLPIDSIEVRTGVRFDFTGILADITNATLRKFAERFLANPVIQEIHDQPYSPSLFQHGHEYQLKISQVAIRELDDAGLMVMSRQSHLFLSLDEMRAIRDHYRAANRDPNDIELETIAQTWSEHCVHKTLKATISYKEPSGHAMTIGSHTAGSIAARPGHKVHPDGTVVIENLLKSTIAAATFKLMEEPHFKDWCISVFKDNAGIVRFDEEHGVCIKVETHNHPSAIEPYGGAATGIGGCIRDVMGTGLGARPIANTNVFCVAFSDPSPNALTSTDLPKGVIHPRRTLQQVVAGVRDYGNRMGIPTVNGAVWFHNDYVANPLVFAGCIGLIPSDKCFGTVGPGDHIIALGGRTGRDGIHGATFSSAELTDTHADEFAHAVQIGNAITQKKTLDVLLQARDIAAEEGGCLFTAITDCGAGGFSSAVGEMAKDLGATVNLDAAPLKYQGLSYTEIWISEAQERMVLAVPEKNLARLRAICEAQDVEMSDLGIFGDSTDATDPKLRLFYRGTQVGTLSMHFLHDGIPTPTRSAAWRPTHATAVTPAIPSSTDNAVTVASDEPPSIHQLLIGLLSHPNIASKHWIIRQYDHEVQGGSVIKPLVGPGQDGPGDAAVLRPKLGSNRGIAVGCGLQTGMGEKTPGGDSYWMTLAAIDEAIRNVVCAGADPDRIAILDNFCWPRCDDPYQLGSLVRAAEACYDGALAYRTPFVSGKDSLSNQFTTEQGRLITIPPTLLVTALGIVPDVTKARTMDAKAAGNYLLIIGETRTQLGGSHVSQLFDDGSRDRRVPETDLVVGPKTARLVAGMIASQSLTSIHDISDGGVLACAAEMAFAGRIGLDLDLDGVPTDRMTDEITTLFVETPSRYLIEVDASKLDSVVKTLRASGIAFGQIGRFASHGRLTVRSARSGRILDASLDELRDAWKKPLDW